MKFFKRTIFQVPGAAFTIYAEKSLKSAKSTMTKERLNMVYYLFWTKSYQLATVLFLFWTDIIPEFGYTDSIQQFWKKYFYIFILTFNQSALNKIYIFKKKVGHTRCNLSFAKLQ